VCIDLLRAMGESVAFCVGESADGRCLGVPVLEGDESIANLYEEGYRRAFVAVGSNTVRFRLGAAVVAQGYELVNAISPHAVLSPSVRIGRGVAVMAGVVVNADSEVGDLAIINTGATVDHDCRISEGVHIAPQCAIAGTVAIGRMSFLGIGTKVIPGVGIGTNVIVGAGGVVTGDIQDGVTAVGVPARIIKYK